MPQARTPESCHMCMECLRAYSEHVVQNSRQVQEYLDEYSASSSVHRFPQAVLQALRGYAPSPQASSPVERTSRALQHLQHAADFSRAKWTQFNIPLSVLGLFMMMCCVVIVLAAAFAALLLHRVLSLTLAVLAKSCGYSGREEMLLPLLSRQEGAAIAVVLLRAAVPLSNSLVLAEAQVIQYLLSASALLAGTAIYAQIRVVHMSQSKATTSIHCMSPFVSIFGVFFLLSHAWERVVGMQAGIACTVGQLKCHRLYSHGAPTLMWPAPQFAARISIIFLVCVAASTGLLVASIRRFPSLLYLHGQNNKAVWALTSFVLLLSRLWRSCLHGQSLCFRCKPVHLPSLEFAKVACCTVSVMVCSSLLASIGAVDRVGLSPFQKTDQLHPHARSAGTAGHVQGIVQLMPRSKMTEGRDTSEHGIISNLWWYQWIYPVPALLCLAYVSHVVQLLPRRVAFCSTCAAEQCIQLRCIGSVLRMGGRLLASMRVQSDTQVCPQHCTNLGCVARCSYIQSIQHLFFSRFSPYFLRCVRLLSDQDSIKATELQIAR